jgi:hypothetical protein
MVCTPPYFERFHGMTLPGSPCGVQWESRTIQNRAYYHTLRAGFVPLVFSGSGAEFAPAVALGNAVPLQWPKDDAWDTSEILNRLVPEGDRQGWPALEIPVPKADAAAILTAPADVFGPSVITDDIVSRLLNIDDRIEAFAKAYQARHNPPGLIPDDYSWRSSTSQDPSFAELRYEQRWLEYRPSPDAEARIERFLNDPRDWLWWGVVAPGGVGKSRFGLELIKKAHGRGWDVAFSNDSSETKWLEQDHKGWRPHKPTLLVYDYANFRGQKIIQVLKGLRDSLRNKYFPPVRILLLDRPGGIGQPPGDITTGWETTRRNVREALYAEPRSAPPTTDERGLALARPESQTDRRPLARDDELLRLELPARTDWPGILAEIVRAASSGSASLTFPLLSDTNWWDKVDRLTHSGRMLHLQLLGIVMARAGDVSIGWISDEKGRHDLLDEMLEYERKHRWVLLFGPKMRGEESEISGNPQFKALIKAAGFVTLNRGLSLGTDEEKLLIETTGVEARDFRILRNILRYRDDLTDPDNRDATIERFEPLEPDLLGEWLLIKLIQPFFSKQDEREQLSTHCRLNMDPANFVTAAIRTNPLGLAQTLRLLVDDFPNDPGTLRWFCAVLDAFASVSPADEKTNFAIGEGRLETAQAVSRFSMQQTDDTGWKAAFNRFASVAPLELKIGFGLQSESGCATDPSRMWHRQFLELAASTIRASDRSFASLIDFLAAVAAFNAITSYGQAGRFDELERWGEVVDAVVVRFPADAAIGLEQAQAAFNAITGYGRAGRFDELERWGEVLAAAFARFPADAAIGLEQAKAASNAITVYGQAERFDELERWGEVVEAVVVRFPADAAIGLVQARAAVNAISYYGQAGRFDELERWGEILAAAVARFPADAAIGLEQAQAAFSAISCYGKAGRFDELERWCATIESALARSDVTPELFRQTLGMTIQLFNTNKPVTAAPFMAVARYWPGYVMNTANGNVVLCQLMAVIDKAACDLHLSRLARTYEIYNAFARNQYSSIEAAQAAMRELWPLRMYMPDRGDGLVPLLGQLDLDDLVAEAARDPWRRASEKTPGT